MPTESDKPTVFDILGWEWDEKAEGLWWVEEAEGKKTGLWADCDILLLPWNTIVSNSKKKKVY